MLGIGKNQLLGASYVFSSLGAKALLLIASEWHR